MHETPTSYAIFWGPSWNNGTGGLTSDGQIPQSFLTDTGGTTFETVLTQYGDNVAHIASTEQLNGIYLDVMTPPSDLTCGAPTIEDSDLQNEVATVAAARGWALSSANTTVFIYTPSGYIVNDGTGACSEQAFCAYHGWSSASSVAYAAMPYPTNLTSCGAPSTPNNNAAGDALANATSYELFNSASDPQVGTGWVDASGFEIGDKCAYDFSAGLTQLANAHTYELQTEYSNASSSCVTTTQSHFVVAPASITLTTATGVSPAPQTLTITNTGVTTLNWTLSSTLPSWLTLSATSGAIAVNGNQTLTLSFSTNGATPQAYTTTLVLSDPGADNSPFSVPVAVSSAAHMQVAPSSVSLTTPPTVAPPSQTVTLQNTGVATLNWSLTSSLPTWLTVSPLSGAITGQGSQPITLTFTTPNATAQTYSTTLVFTDPAADNSPVSVPVTLIASYPHLQSFPGSVALQSAVGVTPTPQLVTLTNTGLATSTWSLASTLPSWLAVTPTSGSLMGNGSQTLTLTFAANPATPITYTTTLSLTDPHADNSPLSIPVTLTVTSQLSAPWSDQDIGAVGMAGSASNANGKFTVLGAGSDIGGNTDSFNFAYRPLTGDMDIVARVTSMTATDTYAKAGVMMRQSFDPGAPNIGVYVTKSGGTFEVARSASSPTAFSISGANSPAPYWIELQRHGNSFSTYTSPNGSQWTLLGAVSLSMSGTIYVGLAVTSRATNALNTAQFDHVQLSTPGYLQATPSAIYTTATPGANPTPQTVTLSNAGGRAISWNLVSTLPSWLTVSAVSGRLATGASQSITLSFSTPSTTPTTYQTSLLFSGSNSDNSPLAVPVTVVATTTPIPAPWADLDIGAPAQAGSATYTNGVFTVQGGGYDIWNSSDQFNFMYQPLTGDGQITAHVASQQNTNGWALAGVMMRETLAFNAAYALTTITPGNGSDYHFRTATNAGSGHTSGPGGVAPYWVKVARAGNTFTSSASVDGVNWTQIGSQTIPMAQTIYVGLAVTAHDNNQLNTSTFDNVAVAVAPYSHLQPTPAYIDLSVLPGVTPPAQTITLSNTGGRDAPWALTSALPPWLTLSATSGTIPAGASVTLSATFSTTSATPTVEQTRLLFATPTSDTSLVAVPVSVMPIPTPWADLDIGAPAQAGSASATTGTFSIVSDGGDIGNTSDQFNFMYQPLTGDGQITAHITSQQNTSSWAKAGVMMRESLTAGSPHMSTLMTPGNGVTVNMRITSNPFTYGMSGPGGTAPYWLRLARAGNTYTSSTSADGVNWTQISSQSISMAQTIYVGLAVTSNSSQLNTTTFDNVVVATPPYSHLQAAPGAVYTTTAPGASPANQTFTLTNTSTQALTWTLASTVPSWLTVSPASDTLAAGATETVTLTFATTSTTPTTYRTNLLFSSPTSDDSPLGVPVTVVATTTPIPTPWADLDIGAPGQAGSAAFSTGTFTVQGGGSDIWNSSDQFNFMYQPLTGNGQITAHVASLQNTNGWAKAGVMMRETLAASSVHAMTVVSASNGTGMDIRATTNASASYSTGPSGAAPYWVKLVRANNTFTSYVSPDGVTWTQISVQTIPMAQTIYVGLAVTANNNNLLNTSTFDNITVN